MNKLKYILTLLFILPLSLVKSQQRAELINGYNIPVAKGIPNLEVGNMLPDFEIVNIINSERRSINTSQFKDKLLIIDFWYTTCGSCLVAMPKLESLQKQFGDKIKVLPVTYESEIRVTDFWKKNKYIKNVKLPSVVEDSVIRAYFLHLGAPHEVWVYKGKVIAITGQQYVDAANIQKVLNGETINWPVKNDFNTFDGEKHALFKPDSNQIDTGNTFLYYSAISDYKEGVSYEGLSAKRGIVRDPIKKTVRFYAVNESIFTSYFLNQDFLPREGKLIKPSPDFLISSNEVTWEVTDKSKYKFDNKTTYQAEWIRRNGICFESVKPDTGQPDKKVYESVIKDMNRLLGLDVRWEKRNEKVLLLVRTGKIDKIKSKGLPEKNNMQEGGINSIGHLRNSALSSIVYSMNQEESNPYVFDETNYKGLIDMKLNIPSWTAIVTIRKELQRYGLDLKEERRLVDKLIFSEVDGGLLVDGAMQSTAIAKRAAQKELKDPTPEENKLFHEQNKVKDGVIELPSGLQYMIIEQGRGAKPGLESKVKVHYTGTLVNGKIFDSSHEKGTPYTTKVSNVIKGWTEALQLMTVGSKWVLYVPAHLAYGDHTGNGTVPPNSTLIFELELIAIEQ